MISGVLSLFFLVFFWWKKHPKSSTFDELKIKQKSLMMHKIAILTSIFIIFNYLLNFSTSSSSSIYLVMDIGGKTKQELKLIQQTANEIVKSSDTPLGLVFVDKIPVLALPPSLSREPILSFIASIKTDTLADIHTTPFDYENFDYILIPASSLEYRHFIPSTSAQISMLDMGLIFVLLMAMLGLFMRGFTLK